MSLKVAKKSGYKTKTNSYHKEKHARSSKSKNLYCSVTYKKSTLVPSVQIKAVRKNTLKITKTLQIFKGRATCFYSFGILPYFARFLLLSIFFRMCANAWFLTTITFSNFQFQDAGLYCLLMNFVWQFLAKISTKLAMNNNCLLKKDVHVIYIS